MIKQFFCILFLSILIYLPSTAQKALNVQLTTTDKEMIISYDLDGRKNTAYDVDLKIKKSDGHYINPKSIKGDFGKVVSGKGKAIIWNVYKDIDGLSGSVEPIVLVNEIKRKKISSKPKVAPTPTPASPGSTGNSSANASTKKRKDNNQNSKRIIDIQTDRDRKYSKTRFGFKAALGSTNAKVSERSDYFNRKFSWQMGSFMRWSISRKFCLQPELLYHRQSWKEIINENENVHHNHHYLRGQVVAGFSPLGLGLQFNTGLYYGYLLGVDNEYKNANETTNLKLADYPKVNNQDLPFNRNDAGLIIGGSININRGAFAIGAWYSQSFTSLLNSDYYKNDGDRSNLDLYNKGIHFYIQKGF